MPDDNEFTRILQWPGYRVYRHKIDEKNKILELWVRRKRGNGKLECSGCGRKFSDTYDCGERAVRDLPWSEFKTAVYIEVYRVKCPDCGVKVEKVPLLPGKPQYSSLNNISMVFCSITRCWQRSSTSASAPAATAAIHGESNGK